MIETFCLKYTLCVRKVKVMKSFSGEKNVRNGTGKNNGGPPSVLSEFFPKRFEKRIIMMYINSSFFIDRPHCRKAAVRLHTGFRMQDPL